MAVSKFKSPVKVDKVDEVLKSIVALSSYKVMAGVPSKKTDRRKDEDDKQPITNAALAYIHNHGAPEVGIPARPSMIPAVREAKSEIVRYMKLAGELALEGEEKKMMQALNSVGIVAQNAIRKKITEGPFVPLKPATIKRRQAKRKKKSAQSTDIRPLIVTGQYRAAHAYVIRKVK